MFLVNFTKEGILESHSSGIHSIPEIQTLISSKGEKWFHAVALYCDYYSPYRSWKEGQDRATAIFKGMGIKPPKQFLSDPTVKEAMKAYEFVQMDPVYEFHKVVQDKLHEVIGIMKKTKTSEENFEKVIQTVEKAEKLRDKYQASQDRVLSMDGGLKLRGDRIPSWLEKNMHNK